MRQLIPSLVVLMLPAVAEAQPAAEFPSKEKGVGLAFSTESMAEEASFELAEEFGPENAAVVEAEVTGLRWRLEGEEDAPWMQLLFDELEIGEGSYLTIRSVADGEVQRLDARAAKHWQGSSAVFNGDAVELELHLARGDDSTRFEVANLLSGERTPSEETICGLDDNRTASSEPGIGRIRPVGCTGWLIANGAVLTAGHCTDDGTGARMLVLEFDVPPSHADGTPVAAAVNDQYEIDRTSIVSSDGGVGADWAIFRVLPNSNTQLLPAVAENRFYRLTDRLTPTNLEITGFGIDDRPPGSSIQTNFKNAQNQSQQTHQGAFVAKAGGPNPILRYRVDTEGGNSGSPILDAASRLAVGIHTNGGCDADVGANQGTAIEQQDLSRAIGEFTGARVIFVDRDHPEMAEDGSIFRPFDTLGEAIAVAPPGAIINVAPGIYPDQSVPASSGLTIVTPAGPFTLAGAEE